MNMPSLTNFQRGSIFIIMGFILLLYSFGIFKQELQLVIVLGSILLILYGFILGDFWAKIKLFITQLKNN